MRLISRFSRQAREPEKGPKIIVARIFSERGTDVYSVGRDGVQKIVKAPDASLVIHRAFTSEMYVGCEYMLEIENA